MHHVVFFLSSCPCIVASHLGTLDVQHVDAKHVLTEPKHKTVLGGRILKRKGPAGATEDPAQSEGPNVLLVLTLTHCYPRHAPEHNP